MSILSLYDATLIVANHCLLEKVNLQIHAHARIALVGRNGAGKSSFLQLLRGDLNLDEGKIHYASGLKIAGLCQDVPVNFGETVYHYLTKGLGEVGEVLALYHHLLKTQDLEALVGCQHQMDSLHGWEYMPQIESMASRLGIDTNLTMDALSGGMKRRVLLAAALIADPDLLLLDEPTNHLDIESIEWLESYLKNFNGTVVVVTHDQEFLQQVATSIIEIDRAKLFVYDCNYAQYLERQEAVRLQEEKQNALFDKHLAQEEVWIRKGVQARRARNEGRVRALKALREEHKARREALGKVKSLSVEGNQSGFIVIEARAISYKNIIQDCSLLINRGDKLGILGPNGCGKTTLVRLLLGELIPDSGVVKQGTSLQIAYFDQLRSQLQEEKTLRYNVADGADYVIIHGKQKHVVSYLQDFLFPSERLNQPVSSLSGGEKNRLLLAQLFAKPVNFLVLDEPTNDLDLETLELLEQILVDYKGTLIIISHDRAFINKVVTSILVYQGQGHFCEFFGGYDDYKHQQTKQTETRAKKTPESRRSTEGRTKLTYNEQRELNELPGKIGALEDSIKKMQLKIADPEFYQKEADVINEFMKQLAKEEALLEECLTRWEDLEEKSCY